MMNDENRQIARKTLEIIPLVMRVMSAEMRSTGQVLSSGHVAVLGILNYRPHTLTDLADRYSVSSPTMSNTVTVMEERGWVARHRSDQDRRVVWIEITEEGRAVLDNINRHVEERIAGFLSGLSGADQETLVDGLTVLRDVFAAALERDPVLRQE